MRTLAEFEADQKAKSIQRNMEIANRRDKTLGKIRRMNIQDVSDEEIDRLYEIWQKVENRQNIVSVSTFEKYLPLFSAELGAKAYENELTETEEDYIFDLSTEYYHLVNQYIPVWIVRNKDYDDYINGRLTPDAVKNKAILTLPPARMRLSQVKGTGEFVQAFDMASTKVEGHGGIKNKLKQMEHAKNIATCIGASTSFEEVAHNREEYHKYLIKFFEDFAKLQSGEVSEDSEEVEPLESSTEATTQQTTETNAESEEDPMDFLSFK